MEIKEIKFSEMKGMQAINERTREEKEKIVGLFIKKLKIKTYKEISFYKNITIYRKKEQIEIIERIQNKFILVIEDYAGKRLFKYFEIKEVK